MLFPFLHYFQISWIPTRPGGRLLDFAPRLQVRPAPSVLRACRQHCNRHFEFRFAHSTQNPPRNDMESRNEILKQVQYDVLLLCYCF